MKERTGLKIDFAVEPMLAGARKMIVLTVFTSDEDGASEETTALELGLTLELVG